MKSGAAPCTGLCHSNGQWQLLSACALIALCRRLADAFCARASQRRFAAALRAWRDAAAERRRRRAQGAHVAALLQRRALGRVLAGWRRAALAGKLCHTLAVVRELQGAVERVSEELTTKAQQVRAGRQVGAWALVCSGAPNLSRKPSSASEGHPALAAHLPARRSSRCSRCG